MLQNQSFNTSLRKSNQGIKIDKKFLKSYCNEQNLSQIQKFYMVNGFQSQKLQKINGMELMPRLIELNLSNNDIAEIENLQFNSSLKILDLSFNQINSVNNLEGLKNLKCLYLQGNQVSNIPQYLPQSLVSLNLSENQLSQLREINYLKDLESLEDLELDLNPFCTLPHYQYYIICNLSQIQILDSSQITQELRNQASKRFLNKGSFETQETQKQGDNFWESPSKIEDKSIESIKFRRFKEMTTPTSKTKSSKLFKHSFNHLDSPQFANQNYQSDTEEELLRKSISCNELVDSDKDFDVQESFLEQQISRNQSVSQISVMKNVSNQNNISNANRSNFFQDESRIQYLSGKLKSIEYKVQKHAELYSDLEKKLQLNVLKISQKIKQTIDLLKGCDSTGYFESIVEKKIQIASKLLDKVKLQEQISLNEKQLWETTRQLIQTKQNLQKLYQKPTQTVMKDIKQEYIKLYSLTDSETQLSDKLQRVKDLLTEKENEIQAYENELFTETLQLSDISHVGYPSESLTRAFKSFDILKEKLKEFYKQELKQKQQMSKLQELQTQKLKAEEELDNLNISVVLTSDQTIIKDLLQEVQRLSEENVKLQRQGKDKDERIKNLQTSLQNIVHRRQEALNTAEQETQTETLQYIDQRVAKQELNSYREILQDLMTRNDYLIQANNKYVKKQNNLLSNLQKGSDLD